MSISIIIALATICFTYNGVQECDPILLGKNIPTPVGEFTLTRRYTKDAGYGGDVLQFYETKDMVYAIHRVWLLKPEQHRLNRLNSTNINDHFITSGCINVANEVYERLIDCCSDQKLIIQ